MSSVCGSTPPLVTRDAGGDQLLVEVADLLRDIQADASLVTLHRVANAQSMRLSERLQLAVVGEVNSGKSTMVNALVGRRAAETSSGENTYVNWWFRFGAHERVVVRRPRGVVEEIAVGQELGEVDRDHAEPVTVYLNSPLLQRITVIDTPGLYSMRADNSDETKKLIEQGRRQSELGAGYADAVIYLTASDLPGERDRGTLHGFASAFGSVRAAPTNALLMLSRIERRIDRRSDTPALEQGAVLAARYRADLYAYVWDIAPVSALAALVARTGDVDDITAAQIRQLADHTRDGGRRALLRTPKSVASGVADLGLDALAPLAQELSYYGVAALLDAVDTGVHDAAGLAAALEAASGMEVVEELVTTTFADRSALIRSDAALAAVEAATYQHREHLGSLAAQTRARCETVRMSSVALSDLADARTVLDPTVGFTAADRDELTALFTSTRRSLLVEPDHARRRADTWVSRANSVASATPQQRRIALRAASRYDRIAQGEQP